VLALERDRYLKRANYRLIEEEIRCYQETKKMLEELRDDVIEGTNKVDGPRAEGQVGDPTGSKAIKLTAIALSEAGKRVAAIERSFEQIKRGDPRRSQSLEMKYFGGYYTDRGIARELGIAESTVRRWRKEFVGLIAEKLGWIV
jgi:RinA family phage transcriptional activator